MSHLNMGWAVTSGCHLRPISFRKSNRRIELTVKEIHHLLGQAIDVRCRNLRGFRCEAMNVPIVQVVA